MFAATWQASDVIALVAVIAGLVGTLGGIWLGAWLTRRREREHRAEDERIRGRDEAARVLGPILAMLVDLQPDRLAVNASEDRLAEIERTWQKWEALRDDLMIVGGSTLVRRVLDHQDFTHTLEDVKSEYLEAQLKATQLQAAISNRAGKNPHTPRS